MSQQGIACKLTLVLCRCTSLLHTELQPPIVLDNSYLSDKLRRHQIQWPVSLYWIGVCSSILPYKLQWVRSIHCHCNSNLLGTVNKH